MIHVSVHTSTYGSVVYLNLFPIQESTLYQHVKDSQEHDAVAWDAAPLNQQGLPLKPLEESGPESGSEEGVEDTALEEVNP